MASETFSELRKIRNEIVHGRLSSSELVRRLGQVGVSVPPDDVPNLTTTLMSVFSSFGGYQIPPPVLQVLAKMLQDRPIGVVCDPWAGLGELLSAACESSHPAKAYALTQNSAEFDLGRSLVSNAEWKRGEPLAILESLNIDFDLVVSILPFGAKSARSLTLRGKDGLPVSLQDDLGHLILAAAASRLIEHGIGLFVVTPSFFLSGRTVLHSFPALGLSVEAALSLPAGSFAPYTNISAYLLVVTKRDTPRMFVAELTNDTNTNAQIVANFQQGKEGGLLELGRFVAPQSFRGLDYLRLAERLEQASTQFGAPAVHLADLATAINLGRSGENFEFPQQPNALFVPMIGISDVVESLQELTLKRQNYAQVVIDPARSDARFVARFLNTELGKDIREGSKSGFIPKLNKQTLGILTIFVPDLQTQKVMLETEARIAAEQNTLSSLQNELGAFQRELWTNPRSVSSVKERLGAFSARLTGGVTEHAAQGLEQWCETLPFPLASICRAWQATENQDFKTKYEHLLHFFEAAAEFVSVILLSAFSSNEAVFAPHKAKLAEEMKRQGLSFARATFGTWKVVTEYLGKQTRLLLFSDNKDDKATCGELFGDLTLELPQVFSRKELAAILSSTNKMRNDWSGHGGVVGQEEAKLRNEQLLAELQKLREAFTELWASTQLIHPLNCRPRRGVFENEVSILMGSNSEFLKDTRPMAMWLDVERLYLCHKDSGQALRLLPLVQVGPSPKSAKNACYFFNRIERDGAARFISYHFIDEPELTGQFDQAATETIKLLTEQ